MAELLDRITTKVGPLPAWAWAAIPASGYVAWSYFKASREPSYIDPTLGGGADGTGAEDYGLNTGGAFLPGYGAAPSGSSNAVPEVEMPEFNNQSWFKQVSNWLISEGTTSTDAVTALNAYLYGAPEEINSTQMNALQRALIRFGAAPDPAFVPKTSAPAPAPKPAVIGVPGAPTSVQARANGKTAAVVSWNVPQTNGGSAIIGYKIEQRQKQPNGTMKLAHTKLALPGARSMTFPVRQREWNTFIVYARNVKGYGPSAYQSLRIP